jgi:hypothetical protein
VNSEIFLSEGTRVEKNKIGAFLRETMNPSSKTHRYIENNWL